MNKGIIVIAGIVVLVLGLIAFYWFEVHQTPGVSSTTEAPVAVVSEPAVDTGTRADAGGAADGGYREIVGGHAGTG